MGRIVAYWLLVSLGNFIIITEVAEIFLLIFFHGKSYAQMLTKK
jgi:hypothetical protein